MIMEAKITAEMLRTRGACPPQRRLFEELFGEGTVVTEKLCIEHAELFSWEWAALYLLSEEGLKQFDRESEQVSSEWDNAITAAYAEYCEAENWAVAAREFDEVRIRAALECRRSDAAAFARAFLADHAAKEK